MGKFLQIMVCLVLVNNIVSMNILADNYFVDECTSPVSSAEKTYVNFNREVEDFSVFSGWYSCGDNSVLSMTANRAWVIYHVERATQLNAELYSDGSTFATQGDNGEFQLGFTDEGKPLTAFRCRYQRAQDKIYIRQNGFVYSLLSEKYALRFVQDNGDFSDEDPYYGINVEVSSDGVNYRQVSADLQQTNWQKYENDRNYFREFYSAQLPTDTNYVKLTLYGYNRVPGGWGDAPNFPLLSNVRIKSTEISSSQVPSSSEPEVSSSSESSSSSSMVSSAPGSDSITNGGTDKEEKTVSSERLLRNNLVIKEHYSDENPTQQDLQSPPVPARKTTEQDADRALPFSVYMKESADLDSKESFVLDSQSGQRLLSYYQGGEKKDSSKRGLVLSGVILPSAVAAFLFWKPK